MEDNDTINERKRILEIIGTWRVQLEDKGFITFVPTITGIDF